MQILINGSSIGEITKAKMQNLNNEKSIKDLMKIDKKIAHLKNNKEKYLALVCIIALTVDLSAIPVLADGIDVNSVRETFYIMDSLKNEIIQIVIAICEAVLVLLGVKEVMSVMAKGGGVREASIRVLKLICILVVIALMPTCFEVINMFFRY